MPYCTAKQVKDFTGHKASDFELNDPGTFDAKIEEWIEEAEGLIDGDRNRTFDPDVADVQYAGLLRGITLRITANIMAKALQLRTSPVEKLDDFTARIVDTSVLDDGIKADLKKLPAVARLGLGISHHRRHHHHHYFHDDDDED